MIIDFTEIPFKKTVKHLPDSFELFARDFLVLKGYNIDEQPSRGADGKKDMIVSKLVHENVQRYLVSCKHYAKSGKSVPDLDEPDIVDRITSNSCVGFIAFYSTLPSTSLHNKLEKLKNRFEIITLDRGQIEFSIAGNPIFLQLFQRFFPKSFKQWKAISDYLEPLELFRHFLKTHYSLFWETVFEPFFADEVIFYKSLRQHKSFSDALSFHGFKLLYNESLDDFDLEKPFQYKETVAAIAPAVLVGLPIKDLLTFVWHWGMFPPTELHDHNKVKYFQSHTVGFHMKLKNYLIVNKVCREYLEAVFLAIRKIVN